ncbi:MAG: SCO family protein [Alphaproteobacteria bacterium]|nr:SCO family protein [Alphaproteobacteria bacterium]
MAGPINCSGWGTAHGWLRLFAAGALLTAVGVGTVVAHDGVVHKTDEEARQHLAASPNTPGFPTIKGGDFRLVNQFGASRTSKDPDGRYQLLFFGYANCKAICSVALPRMADVTDRLEKEGLVVTPVLVTVDPERDTVATLKSAVVKIHPRLIGLTGEQNALEEAYKAFQIERKVVFQHPEHGAVYSHGSYIYLLAPDGAFKTILPPILSPKRVAELVQDYATGKR